MFVQPLKLSLYLLKLTACVNKVFFFFFLKENKPFKVFLYTLSQPT